MDSHPSDPLAPDLREAENELEQALAEACAVEPASKIDTGELIRVDELIDSASDAAKRAISLRRRRGADRTKRREGAILREAEAAATGHSAHRIFVDPRGVQWDVFAVYPEARLSVHSQLKGTYPQGWLSFDSGVEKRRFSPVPDDWPSLTDEQLSGICERADVAAPRGARQSRKGSDRPNRQE